MSENSLASKHEPQTIYRKDYQVPAYLVDEVDLIFDLLADYTEVKSTLRVRKNRRSTNQLKKLILNGQSLKLISVSIDGSVIEAINYEVNENYLILTNVPDNFILEIITHIYPHKNTALMGLYRSQQTYCTQCEAEGFRRITYYLDHPDVLAKFSTTIRTALPGYPYLLSNGNLVDQGVAEDGTRWVKWEDPYKKPCYLFALVAGDFDLLQDNFITQSGREIKLQIYVEKGYGDQADHAMYSLKEAMRWDEKAYGREYDLDIYMIVAIGDFNMGAMENKGLNIFNTKYILAKPNTATDDDYMHILSVVGHEYFHNWSGNRVTCRDWFQLSLKEGLTIFRDQNFSEDILSKAVMRIQEVNQLRESQFPEDTGPLAHAVLPESYIEINNFYTMTIYNKGAEVLRMMRTIITPEIFRKGMDLYFARFDGQAVTIEDFVQNMEDISGRDLTQFRRWYQQAGTPIVSIEEDLNTHANTYSLHISQKTLATPGQPEKLPQYIPIRIGLLDSDGKELILEGENIADAKDKQQDVVLHLTEEAQVFRFNNISKRPHPSFFRNFSAPVKLKFNYTNDDLIFLTKFDTDPFNRWEACQLFSMRIILQLISDYQKGNDIVASNELIALFSFLLTQDSDNFFSSELLLLPSEKYIAEQMEVIDVEAIRFTREFLITKLANELHKEFLKIYQAHATLAPYQFNMLDVGMRKIKNRCLSYLMCLPQYYELGFKQFSDSLSKNMTDTEAALVCINHLDIPMRDEALDNFYQTWKHDALVVDKWFSIQAGTKISDALQKVKKLTAHEAFDIKNPNKVFSLIGTFGQRNLVGFHMSDGEGYAFLREMIKQLDALNPQVSARMVKPLTTWKRYDAERQKAMRDQLELLLHSKKVSPDLYEIVSKSLE